MPGAGENPSTALEAARCPRCEEVIDVRSTEVVCPSCDARYPRLGDIPILLPDPHGYLAACRQQLYHLERNARQTIRSLQLELEGRDLVPATRHRCRSMIDGIQRQLADVKGILEPLLPPPTGSPETSGRRQVPATVEYLHYLYRDWGDRTGGDGENEKVIERLREVLKGRSLGRTLVLGAGGCRLAYDLHWSYPESDIVVLDLDPLLFSVAHEITAGGTIQLCEANLEVHEQAQSQRPWTLAAPSGRVERGRFHFLIADGVRPPFGDGTADTVITPWFIDEGPRDVRDLIGTVARILRPGGVWLNSGPLLYERDVPITQRLGREEIFDLVGRAGLVVDVWRTDSEPYLVSKLNGRGRIEWILTFSATKEVGDRSDFLPEGGPPAWLLFHHLPVPAFEGQSLFWSDTPAVRYIVSSIDGHRSIADIAVRLAEEARRSDVPQSELRAVVRECLADVHPVMEPSG